MASWIDFDQAAPNAQSNAGSNPAWSCIDPSPQASEPANPFLPGVQASAVPPAAASQPQQAIDPFDVSLLDRVVSQPAASPPEPTQAQPAAVPEPTPASDNPFLSASADADADDDETEEPAEVPIASLGSLESGAHVAGSSDKNDSKKEEKIILSRQDTFRYIQELQGANWEKKVAAARALKFLAFNADMEYKDGLIKLGFLRTIVAILNTSTDTAANEHAASCMYSMAREHQSSKIELIRLAAPKRLVQLLDSESKQLRLNCTAALYALSCAGRTHCRDIAMLRPMEHLQTMLQPPVGRTAQDDQMQLFSALLVVNIVHAKGAIVPKHARPELLDSLRQAHDDANERQARTIISLGIKHIQRLDSRGSKLKDSMRERSASVAKRLSLSRGSSSNSATLNPLVHGDEPESPRTSRSKLGLPTAFSRKR